MPNDKNRLFTKYDHTRDLKRGITKRTQQQNSRFSVASAFEVNNTTLYTTTPPLQAASHPQIGIPMDDTKGTSAASTQVLNFSTYGSQYTFYNLDGDTVFSFAGLPPGHHIRFTIDITVSSTDTIDISFPQVRNPPVLDGNHGDRYVLSFVAVSRPDLTGMSGPTETYTFISGADSSGTETPTVLNNLDAVNHGDLSNITEQFDWDAGNFHYFTAKGDVQISFTGLPASGKWEPLIIKITMDDVGGHSITFANTFENGNPTINNSADAVTYLKFLAYHNGSQVILRQSAWDAGSGGGGGAQYLNDLDDVSAQNPDVGQALTYDGNFWTSAFPLLSYLNVDVDKNWGGHSITNLSYIQSGGNNIPQTGFVRMAYDQALVWKDQDANSDIALEIGKYSTGNNPDYFNIKLGVSDGLTVGHAQVDVHNSNIVDTGDILKGGGVHNIGTSDDAYTQIHARYFVPKDSAVSTDVYGFGNDDNTLFVNFPTTTPSKPSGFGMYENGVRQFHFRSTMTGGNKDHTLEIGPENFTQGEIYRILLGEDSNSSAQIWFQQGANDLFIDRKGLQTQQSVALSTGSVTRFKVNATEGQMFVPLNMNLQELKKVTKISSDGNGGTSTGVIGDLVTSNGGFNYYMRQAIYWDSNEETKIEFGNNGIFLHTNGVNDSIRLHTDSSSSSIDIYAFDSSSAVNIGSPAHGYMQFFSDVITLQGGNLSLTNGAQYISFLDATLPSNVPTPGAGNVSMFLNSENTQLSVKLNNGTVVSLQGAAQIPALADLTDVSISNPQENQVLTYVGSTWQNADSSSGGASRTLNNLESPTAINQSLIPSNNILNLGVLASSWRNVFCSNLRLVNTGNDPVITGQMVLDGSDVKVYSGGGVKNLSDIGAGGSQTPWLSTIDAALNNLRQMGRLEFGASSEGSAGVNWIAHESPFLIYHTNNGISHLWKINAQSKFNIGSNTTVSYNELNMRSHKITNVTDPTTNQDAATKGYVDKWRTGLQDSNIWIIDETDQFDHEVFITNSKQGHDIANHRPLTEDTIFYVPIFINQRTHVDKFGYNVAYGAGTYTVQMGIYSNRTDGQNYPASELTSVSLRQSGNGLKLMSPSGVNLEPGLYWLAIICIDNPTVTITEHSDFAANSVGCYKQDYSGSTPSQMLPILGYTKSGESGLPSTPDEEMTAIALNPPALFVKLEVNPN